LLRGEPGIGKSQLARAAALELHRAFIPYVVDARSESRDLLWHFDAIARLADAQVAGARSLAQLKSEPGAGDRESASATDPGSDPLAVGNYLRPGPLWWAFDWGSAREQAGPVGVVEPLPLPGCDAVNGAVVLIDEIDKAEADLPNGLLEALGNGEFSPQGLNKTIMVREPPPLVIITTNEERALPDAFVRRCLVLHLGLPRDEQALQRRLIARGRAHLEHAGRKADQPLLERAAQLLAGDRATARDNHWRPLPGQAEFLDLLWAVVEQVPDDDPDGQRLLIDQVACYLLKKHPDAGDLLLADGDEDEPGSVP